MASTKNNKKTKHITKNKKKTSSSIKKKSSKKKEGHSLNSMEDTKISELLKDKRFKDKYNKICINNLRERINLFKSVKSNDYDMTKKELELFCNCTLKRISNKSYNELKKDKGLAKNNNDLEKCTIKVHTQMSRRLSKLKSKKKSLASSKKKIKTKSKNKKKSSKK